MNWIVYLNDELIARCTFGDDAKAIFDTYDGKSRACRVVYEGLSGQSIEWIYLPKEEAR